MHVKNILWNKIQGFAKLKRGFKMLQYGIFDARPSWNISDVSLIHARKYLEYETLNFRTIFIRVFAIWNFVSGESYIEIPVSNKFPGSIYSCKDIQFHI